MDLILKRSFVLQPPHLIKMPSTKEANHPWFANALVWLTVVWHVTILLYLAYLTTDFFTSKLWSCTTMWSRHSTIACFGCSTGWIAVVLRLLQITQNVTKFLLPFIATFIYTIRKKNQSNPKLKKLSCNNLILEMWLIKKFSHRIVRQERCGKKRSTCLVLELQPFIF